MDISVSELWHKKYGQTPPLGYLLRENFKDRWIRFHALPKSKRYANNDEEKSVILNRANILAKKVLGGEPCYLMVSYPSYDGEDISENKDSAKHSYGLEKSFEWKENDDGSAVLWANYSKLTYWSSDKFFPLITRIADDEEAPTLWFSVNSLEVFAPYDGGFDIICQNPEQVVQLQNKYSDWMSSRSDWL